MHCGTFTEAFDAARSTGRPAVVVVGMNSWRIRRVFRFRREDEPLRPVPPNPPKKEGELILPPQVIYTPPPEPAPAPPRKTEAQGSLF